MLFAYDNVTTNMLHHNINIIKGFIRIVYVRGELAFEREIRLENNPYIFPGTYKAFEIHLKKRQYNKCIIFKIFPYQ